MLGNNPFLHHGKVNFRRIKIEIISGFEVINCWLHFATKTESLTLDYFLCISKGYDRSKICLFTFNNFLN